MQQRRGGRIFHARTRQSWQSQASFGSPPRREYRLGSTKMRRLDKRVPSSALSSLSTSLATNSCVAAAVTALAAVGAALAWTAEPSTALSPEAQHPPC